MNERSSRSHAIFSITVECSEKGPDGQHHVRMGKLHLVDLAVGSSNFFYTVAILFWGFYFLQTSNLNECILSHPGLRETGQDRGYWPATEGGYSD